MNYIGIDPSDKGFVAVLFDGTKATKLGRFEAAEFDPKDFDSVHVSDLVDSLKEAVKPLSWINRYVIEVPTSTGQLAGNELFRTANIAGRTAGILDGHGRVNQLPRTTVKRVILGTPSGTDAQIRNALLSLVGEPGKKKTPGPTYGLAGDDWAALAVAYTQWALDQNGGPK